MIEEKFITAVIVGHAEHGKTTLARCLAGVDSEPYGDRNRGLLCPGMTFTPFWLPSGVRIALVEMPEHGDRQTDGTVNRVDLTLLVVAADDGVMPRTVDQLDLLNRFKAAGGLAVITKADLVDDETVQLARMEIQEITKGSCLDGKPIIPFSKADLRGLDTILAAMEEEANGIEGCSYFSTGHYKTLKKRVLEMATRILVQNVFTIAVSSYELASQLDPPVDELLLRRILDDLKSDGKLVAIEGGFRIPTLSVRLPRNRARCAEEMLQYARDLGYVTFTARTFSEAHWKDFNLGEIQELLEYLRQKKKLVRLDDGRYLTCEAIEEIGQKVTELILRKGSLRVQDSWEILGYGRNRAIPVFDYLDEIGLTVRMDDFRILK